jgi:hypothetical protein
MKKLQYYLAESAHTYDYRIKVVGDVPAGFFDQLKEKLSQFDVVKMTNPKSTPVQKLLKDFPNEENQSMSFVDVSFRYPAIEPQVQRLAEFMGVSPNRVCMNDLEYSEGMAKEIADIEAQNKDLLTDTDFPAPDAKQKELSQDYSADPYKHAVLQNAYRSEFTVAGGKTPAAKTTNDLPQGEKSPFANIKRPPKPATGASPKG